MITISITGFRCYEQEKTFTFNSNSINRIQGLSGIGKTTILDAIQWVLYNYPTTNIYPRSGKEKNTRVILTFPWKDGVFKVERRKNPGYLEITHPNRTIEVDDVGQSTIISLFGSRDLWRVCSYLPQDEYCPLLAFSNQQRMEIIESLAFLDSNPNSDIEVITQEITRLEERFRREQDLLGHKKLPSFCLDGEFESYLLSPETRLQYQSSLRDLGERVQKLKEEKAVAEDKKNLIDTLKTKVNKIQKKLLDLEVTTPNKLQTLTCDIAKLEKELGFSTQYQKYQTLIARKNEFLIAIGDLEPLDRNYTPMEYKELLILETKIEGEKAIAKQWNLPYDSGQIRSRIVELTRCLEGQKDLALLSRIQSLEKKRDLLPVEEDLEEKISALKEKIRSTEESSNIHLCPSCSQSLRIIGKKLVISDLIPSSDNLDHLKTNLKLLESKLKQSKDRASLETEILSLRSTIFPEIVQGKLLTDIQVKVVTQEKKDLTSLTFPFPSSITCQDVEATQFWYHCQDEIRKIDVELAKLELASDPIRNPDIILKELKEAQDRYNFLIKIDTERTLLLRQYQEFVLELEVSSNQDPILIQREIIKLLDRLEGITSILDQDRIAREYQNQLQDYTDQEQVVNKCNHDLEIACRFRDLAIREFCSILEEKIASINSALLEIVTKVFREPITIELSMLKITKSTKIFKPCVHLKIWYKDAEHDNLSTMSGGEKKRVSLAVSLALSQLNLFPLVLFDECLNGLDEELKEVSLETLQSFRGGKSVICVMHDGMTGYFDHVLTIE